MVRVCLFDFAQQPTIVHIYTAVLASACVLPLRRTLSHIQFIPPSDTPLETHFIPQLPRSANWRSKAPPPSPLPARPLQRWTPRSAIRTRRAWRLNMSSRRKGNGSPPSCAFSPHRLPPPTPRAPAVEVAGPGRCSGDRLTQRNTLSQVWMVWVRQALYIQRIEFCVPKLLRY